MVIFKINILSFYTRFWYNPVMEKIAVLLNPSAGKGKSIKKKEKIERSLHSARIPYDVFVSESEAHLRRLAHRAINDYRGVVGVGGDTTFKIIAGEILKNRSNSLQGKKCSCSAESRTRIFSKKQRNRQEQK